MCNKNVQIGDVKQGEALVSIKEYCEYSPIQEAYLISELKQNDDIQNKI